MRSANGTQNKLSALDRVAHDWYRFVLSFPPHLVRNYLQRFGIGSDHAVLDPFCGTGTTIVECKKLGIPSVGVEANPFAHFASVVKTDWSPDPDGLLKHAREVAELAREKLQLEGFEDEPTLPLFRRARTAGPDYPTVLRKLPLEKEQLLLTNSISPLPLHKTLVLLACLDQTHNDEHRKHELLALGTALVHSISNLHFGPEVGVAPAKPDSPVVAPWLAMVETMAADLRSLRKMDGTPTAVHHADARQISQLLPSATVDAVITSPPYPNEKDYTRTTRLESVLLGFISSKSDLQALKQGLVRSNTRGSTRATMTIDGLLITMKSSVLRERSKSAESNLEKHRVSSASIIRSQSYISAGWRAISQNCASSCAPARNWHTWSAIRHRTYAS